MILDSLDDIQFLQESPVKDQEGLHSLLVDRQLHALLEVSTFRTQRTKKLDMVLNQIIGYLLGK